MAGICFRCKRMKININHIEFFFSEGDSLQVRDPYTAISYLNDMLFYGTLSWSLWLSMLERINVRMRMRGHIKNPTPKDPYEFWSESGLNLNKMAFCPL